MTWRGGRVVCRPGRGEQQLKNRPVRETGWAITGAQSGFEPLPRHCRDTGCWGKQMWAGARLPACWAGAQSQSRLAGCAGHTSAAEVLTCRDEEASICYLSGEFLIPLQWLTRRCFSRQVNPPLQDPGRSPRLQSPLSVFRAPRGRNRTLPGHLDLGGCVPASLPGRWGLNGSQDSRARCSGPQPPKHVLRGRKKGMAGSQLGVYWWFLGRLFQEAGGQPRQMSRLPCRMQRGGSR